MCDQWIHLACEPSVSPHQYRQHLDDEDLGYIFSCCYLPQKDLNEESTQNQALQISTREPSCDPVHLSIPTRPPINGDADSSRVKCTATMVSPLISTNTMQTDNDCIGTQVTPISTDPQSPATTPEISINILHTPPPPPPPPPTIQSLPTLTVAPAEHSQDNQVEEKRRLKPNLIPPRT